MASSEGQNVGELNGEIRKSMKNELLFYADQVVMGSLYRALKEFSKKWTMPVRNLDMVLNQFLTIFENKVKL